MFHRRPHLRPAATDLKRDLSKRKARGMSKIDFAQERCVLSKNRSAPSNAPKSHGDFPGNPAGAARGSMLMKQP
jgi:hypothetical protein